MEDFEIRRMHSSEAKHLEYVTSAAFQSNPMCETLYQTTGEDLCKMLEKDMFGGMYTEDPQETFVALHNGKVVGCIRSRLCSGDHYSWHSCSDEEYDYIVNQKIEDLSIEQRFKWLGKTCKGYDPAGLHSHMGPIAVLPRLQGKGIGTLLMEDYFSRIGDRASFLETFQEINVCFYEKCGYRIVNTEYILGLKGYWMTRD
jgi:predicted N-acetyltransferase YhbS